MTSPVQLINGHFQDPEGNLLVNGYLKMRLSQDGTVIGVGSVCSGIEITIQLDASGNVVASPAQSVWGNDAISPVNTYYLVTGYTAQGQPAWGPNVQQVVGSGTFDVGTWVPNTVISWIGTVLAPPVALAVNGTPNQDQQLLNLVAKTGISIIDVGGGEVDISATSSGPVIQVNGTPLTTPSPANFTQDTGILITNPSAGVVKIKNTSPGSSFSGSGAFFFGPGITNAGDIYGATFWNQVIVNSANGSSTANQVVVYLFELFSSFTISKASLLATNNAGGVHGFAGIYDITGAKILDAGSFQALTGPGIQTNNVNGGTPVTLPPGLYWHAQASDSASGGATFTPGVNITTSVENNVISMFIKNATRVAIAANPLSSGVLPATLGTLTPFTPTHTNSDGVVCPLYE